MKGEGIIGAADTVTKAYIRKNEVFADAFNYFMYDGRQKIQPEQLRELDSTEIAILLNEKDTKDKTNKEKEASEQKMVQKYRLYFVPLCAEVWQSEIRRSSEQ